MINKHFLNVVLSFLASICFTGTALANSAYLTGTAGLSHHEYTADIHHESGFAYRLGVGLPLSEHFSTELGYGRYHTVKSTEVTSNSVWTDKYTHRAYDLIVKGTLPLENGFSVFGDGGVAYVKAHHWSGGTINSNNYSYPTEVHYYAPTLGLGATYALTSHAQVVAEWKHINAHMNRTDSNIGQIDYAGLGVNFLF